MQYEYCPVERKLVFALNFLALVGAGLIIFLTYLELQC
jgi:hypothetical protein